MITYPIAPNLVLPKPEIDIVHQRIAGHDNVACLRVRLLVP
jgi:hypothetical protein